jgi:hypothetical protein
MQTDRQTDMHVTIRRQAFNMSGARHRKEYAWFVQTVSVCVCMRLYACVYTCLLDVLTLRRKFVAATVATRKRNVCMGRYA